MDNSLGNSHNTLTFNIRDLSNLDTSLLSDVNYLDTCSLIDLIANRDRKQSTEDFLKLLYTTGNMITWSSHTIEELIQFLHVNEYKNLARQRNIHAYNNKAAWKVAEDRATSQEATLISTTVTSKVSQIETLLNQYGLMIDVPRDLHSRSTKIYNKYGGNLADAKHIAIASANEINSFITADNGFVKYPNQNLYSANTNLSNTIPLSNNAGNNRVQLNSFVDLLKSPDNN